jgi:hypothetical protein
MLLEQIKSTFSVPNDSPLTQAYKMILKRLLHELPKLVKDENVDQPINEIKERKKRAEIMKLFTLFKVNSKDFNAHQYFRFHILRRLVVFYLLLGYQMKKCVT